MAELAHDCEVVGSKPATNKLFQENLTNKNWFGISTLREKDREKYSCFAALTGFVNKYQ